jgi:stage II sporulation protein AA (anti-sigma F factor antagonist)
MDLQIVEAAEGTVVTVDGRFDATAVAEARPLLERIPHESRDDVYIDLSRVTFIDASALGLCVFLFKRLAAERRKLFFTAPIGQPRRLIELLRIDRVIEIRPFRPAQAAAPLKRDLRGDTAA